MLTRQAFVVNTTVIAFFSICSTTSAPPLGARVFSIAFSLQTDRCRWISGNTHTRNLDVHGESNTSAPCVCKPGTACYRSARGRSNTQRARPRQHTARVAAATHSARAAAGRSISRPNSIATIVLPQLCVNGVRRQGHKQQAAVQQLL